MKIISLSSENIKRLSAVEIKPNGDMIVIGGKNGAGKSSVLDSIAYALGGKDVVPSKPIRKGQDHAEVIVDLDSIVVTRRFTDKGSYLSVTNKEGAKYPSPQKMLDELVGKLSFDPLAFSRMKPAEQAQQIRELVGLDTGELDAQRQSLYDQRRDLNRDIKNLEGKLSGLVKHADAPESRVDLTQLIKSRDDAQRRAAASKNAMDALVSIDTNIIQQNAIIDDLEKRLAAAKQALTNFNKMREDAVDNVRKTDNAAASDDIPALDEQIKNADADNNRVRENTQYAEVYESLKVVRVASDGLSQRIARLDADKRKLLSDAKYPVDGLGFTEEGEVVFGGIPFDQASAAEQLRVSVAMGLAMNPKLRVLLIRDGSLLDDDSLGLIAAMATEKDAQVWIERVGDGAEVSVVIEDGAVREAVSA